MTTPPTTHTTPDPSGEPDDIRISQRIVLILLLALIAGCVVGGLTYAAYLNIAQAVLAGLVAMATAAVWLARWIK